MDQFYPEAAIATYKLLLKLGCQVEYPEGQTCCGQPLANAGNELASKASYAHFIEMFEKYDYIVAPSGSCVYHVRHHFDLLEQTEKLVIQQKDKQLPIQPKQFIQSSVSSVKISLIAKMKSPEYLTKLKTMVIMFHQY
jgi:heterodisulfide reductase subunit B